MSDFSAFLAQNKVKSENIKFAVSKSFIGADGKPIEWELRAVTADEDEAIRRAATKKTKVPGRSNQYTSEMDGNTYLSKLTAASVVYPDLRNAELQNSYKVMGEEALLKAMLTGGEFVTLSGKVAEINGFDTSIEDSIEEAKN